MQTVFSMILIAIASELLFFQQDDFNQTQIRLCLIGKSYHDDAIASEEGITNPYCNSCGCSRMMIPNYARPFPEKNAMPKFFFI